MLLLLHFYMTAEFIIRLILAAIACGAIGMERQMRGKGAGLRTHVLIGMGSALFMIVSKYGFADVLSLDHVGPRPQPYCCSGGDGRRVYRCR